MTEILLGIFVFTGIIVLLSGVILIARHWLVPRGAVHIEISNAPEKSFAASCGNKLLGVLADADIFLSSSCGGTGICGQCKVKVISGGGEMLPIEQNLINKKDAAEGYRLACQVTVRGAMMVELPPSVFSVRKWTCEVVSNQNVATFIKELIVHLPQGEQLDFEPGSYVLIEAPAHQINFADFDIDDRHREDWDKFDLWNMQSRVGEPVARAYSMASYPGEGDNVRFNIRITLPPMGEKGIPPGKMSSYIFSLKPGDEVTFSGPYGEFFPRYTDAEMIYIGGGSGMAPLRSHILYLLKEEGVTRKISFWYGARSIDEAFYIDDFNELQNQYENFEWHLALSDPKPSDHWQGSTGYIHNVLYEEYLKDHPAPENCEYYMCGPPMMMDAIKTMLDGLGVEKDHIFFDDFGS